MTTTETRSESPPSQYPTEFGNVPALDGVRGIAVIAVLVFHGGFAVSSGGFLGVSTFFTLSGFLIASLLLTEQSSAGRVDLKRFWIRRFRRLMPAAVATIAAIALVTGFVPSIHGSDTLRGDLLSALFYVANWRFILSGLSYADLFAEESPVQHYWSLAIEEQFYVVFPLLAAVTLLVGGRRMFLIVVSGLLAVSVVLPFVYNDDDRIYNGTDVRMAEILVGILLAALFATWRGRDLIRSRRWIAWVGLAGLIISVATWVVTDQSSRWLYNGGFAAYAMASVAIIAAAMQPGSLVSRMLAFRPLRWVGLVSYGMYLFHWPIFLWFDEGTVHLRGLPLFGVRMAITLTVTWLSFHYLEQPFRRGVRPGAGVRHPGLAIAGATGVVLAGVLALSSMFVDETPEAADVFEPPATSVSIPDDVAEPTVTTAPAEFVRDTVPSVTVIGDSIATDLRDGLERRHDALGNAPVVARDLSFPGCGITLGGSVFLGENGEVPVCRQDHELIDELVTAEQPEVAILSVGFVDLLPRKMDPDDEFVEADEPGFMERVRADYESLQSLLLDRGVSVLWVTAPCMSDQRAEEFRIPPGTVERVNEMIEDLAADEPAVEVYDLNAAVCPDGTFVERYEGLTGTDPAGRSDGLHFSEFAQNDLALQLVDDATHVPPPEA